MAKVTPKKTANDAAEKPVASKGSATTPAKRKVAAKKKPAGSKAAKEKAALPDTADDDTDNAKVAATSAKKKSSSKKTATRKKTAKKSASTKTSKVSAKKATQAADTPASSKTPPSKKVPASKAKQAAVAASNLPDSDDDTDIDSDSPVSTTPAVVPYERGSSGHYMNAEQLAHFSKKLAEWKQQLMEEVDRTVGHMKDDATNFPDPNDRATQEEEFSLELRTRDRERKLIKKINEAQKRIDDDEYGYCETCGIEIGVNRLEARPTAELCIDCKTLEEIRERQTA